MKKTLKFSLFAILSLNMSLGEDLGVIQVESSTIEDLITNTKIESSTINNIDEQTINEIDPKNINDLLETIPGITADVRNDAVEIHLRGIGQQEFMWEDTGVAIVIDGVPVLQNGGKVKFNIDEIESIKVIKGSASYLYGNTALAGAVIITTKKSKDKNEASVSVEAGSYGYKNAKAKIYKSDDNYSFNINLNYTDDDSYWNEGKNWTKSANTIFQYYLDDVSDLTFGLNYTDKYEMGGGSVTGVTNATLHPEGVEGDWSWNRDYYSTLTKFYVTYNKDISDTANLKVNTYYYEDEYDYKNSPQDLDGDKKDDSYKNDNSDDIKQFGIKTEFRNEKNNLAYMVGIDIGKRELDKYQVQLVDITGWSTSYAGESEDSNTKENNYALYGETKYKVNTKLTLVGNLRYDINEYDYSVLIHDYDGSVWSDSVVSRDDSFSNITYRLGTTYQINDKKTFFASISTGFRNPTISQMYAGDFDDDYTNNLDIDTQTSITYEAGLRGVTPFGAKCEASIFVTDTKDIIGRNYGTYYGNGDLMYDNIGDARNKGFELSLKGKVKEKFNYNISYTYLDAYYTSHDPFKVDLSPTYRDSGEDQTYDITGNQLPRVPHNKLDVIVNYKPNAKFKFMTEIYAQSKYYADETNLVEMPGYAKVNLKATHYHNKNLELFIKVDNALDKQYYRTVYLFSDKNRDGVLDAEDASITVDPGRVWYAGVKYTF